MTLHYLKQESVASELINLNQLIEDVVSLLPGSTMDATVFTYDLAADLPLIQGDYQRMRRLFRSLLSDVKGTIVLRTEFTYADRHFLTDNFPRANLPEGVYVLIQISAMHPDMDVANNAGFGSIWQFLFPCAVMETKQDHSPETIGPQLFRQAHAGTNRVRL